MYQPDSTYRIQFNASFTFRDFMPVIPYLDHLGIKTIYASPIFAAMPGSGHGYDGTDPNQINPEIGTLEELQTIAGMLRERKMGWIQDFVPNHMAYSIRNPWLCDFLEKGKMSDYDSYFDKNPDEAVMAPFLGVPLEEALEQKQLQLVYENGLFKVRYFDDEFPLNYTAYFDIINHEALDVLELDSLRGFVEKISQITDKTSFSLEWDAFKAAMKNTFEDEALGTALQEALKKFNQQQHFIRELLEVQFYRLCQWSETDTRINYRRFFTINGLLCVNIQYEEVFNHYHQLLQRLVEEDVIQGVRIDHIDGLYDPEGYLQQLRRLLGDHTYIVVEKILGEREPLPASWPVQGTSGYDFLSKANQVLINRSAADGITGYYESITSDKTPVAALIPVYKRRFLESFMQGEWHNLLTQFLSIAADALPAGITEDAVKALIADLLVYCPVYRYYPASMPFDAENLQHFRELLQLIRTTGTHEPSLLGFFEQYFTDVSATDKDIAQKLLHFWRRCMQLSGPLMAKGVEDTLVYNYQPLLALNEVGNDLPTFGISVGDFHEYIQERLQDFPLAMNATATHDTKRGEDARARLQYLSTVAEEWVSLAGKWIEAGNDEALPAEDRYFILQVLYSTILPGQDPETYKERLSAFLVKAAREAKKHSGWDKPDEAYEQQLIDYAITVLDAGNPIHKELQGFLNAHERNIALQSVMQLTLKYTCPGVPDTYQGTEAWDYSFVDPDNRLPVDYVQRQHTLEKISAEDATIEDWLKGTAAPELKSFVVHRLLQLRRTQLTLFEKGSYEPQEAPGNILYFTRRHYNTSLIVILALDAAAGVTKSIKLPAGIKGPLKNVLTGTVTDAASIDIPAELKRLPVLVLVTVPAETQRKSGVLLPLFSLAAPFGIGGMGKEAYRFLDFLSGSRQQLWQLLPLNPVLEKNAFSPYACISAFAGDQMYIDPVKLLEEGLLEEADVKAAVLPSEEKVHYLQVKDMKEVMLQKAWKRFSEGNNGQLQADFLRFCEHEKKWLDDFALFTVIRAQHNHDSWTAWPEALRERHPEALAVFRTEHETALRYQQWIQFIFYRQWQALKMAANRRNIKLIGDIPFYLSHDSSDVWANPHLFMLDQDGSMAYSAGVPPDYFSKTGQLWGMPTYNWKAMADGHFDWWLQRLEHNARWFDYIRLDHFRAFYDYWEVPASHDNAIKGKWRKGPQDALFDRIVKYFPDLPFLAEDLGEIHQGVFDFMDRYGLPGMRVLQFGFEPYQPQLRDVPHNFKVNTVVYTGTHDNNTIAGWYRSLSADSRKKLDKYTGRPVTADNIHKTMIKMAHGSVADWSIIPMQDILGLDETARINTPSTNENNWEWRLLPGLPDEKCARRMGKWTRFYNR